MRGGHETNDFSAIYEFAMGDDGKERIAHHDKDISYLGSGTIGSGMLPTFSKPVINLPSGIEASKNVSRSPGHSSTVTLSSHYT